MGPKMNAWIVCAACAVVGGGAAGGETAIDPRGVFFHSYTGSFSATEWVHIWSIEGTRRYEFADLRGLAPYRGSISTGGEISWDVVGGRGGGGSFLGQNRASQTLVFNGADFASELWRAPGTDRDFLTRIESRTEGNAAWAGDWRVRIESLDPQTGALLEERTERFEVSVAGELVRLTGETGTFVQGVFETPDHAGFRVVAPVGLGERFRSFAGSETNRGQNVLGDLRFTGEDTFEATMLLQTIAPPGASQHQFVERYTAVRVPAPGGLSLLVLAAALTRASRVSPRARRP